MTHNLQREALDALSRLVSARPDLARERRKGVPEIILADGKLPDEVVGISRQFLEAEGRAIVSRAAPDLAERIRREFSGHLAQYFEAARMLVLKRPDRHPPQTMGCVGVLSAGTSDVPAAQEAAVVAEEMGCRIEVAYDVGVAGLHRLVEPLRRMQEAEAGALVVAAGMDGALPSVVAGLVDVPVIGLPTSIGYGAGGQGLSALLSMLQTCSPGLVVVNIDNGVGAGAAAALIARRAALGRTR